MTDLSSGIWQGTPVWVWPLFFVLLGIISLTVTILFATIIGACSGSFTGCALRVIILGVH